MTIAGWTFLQTGLALLLLGAGVVNDLRARKVQNKIVIAGLVAGLVYIAIAQGTSGLFVSMTSFMTAFVAVLPLYILRVFGGGDVKLFLAISILLSWKEVLLTLLASIIWGSILGVVQIILKGEFKAFAHNIFALINRVKIPEQKVHKIPYTVALLFGYLTSLLWLGVA